MQLRPLRRYFYILALAVLLLAAIGWFTYKPDYSVIQQQKDEPIKVVYAHPMKPLTALAIAANEFSSLRQAFRRAHVSADIFEKLSFVMPGEPGYGTHPELEVFNPAGPLHIEGARTPFSVQPPRKYLIDKVVTDKDTKVRYNLRRLRHDSNKMLVDFIVAVIPNLEEEACLEYGEAQYMPADYNEKLIVPQNEFVVADDNHQIIEDAETLYGPCVRAKDGTYYLFIILDRRMKKFTATEWRPK